MLYREETVRDNIRNLEGKRVFYLGRADQLPLEPQVIEQVKKEIREAAAGCEGRVYIQDFGTSSYMT